MAYLVSGPVGADLDARTTEAEFKLMQSGMGDDGLTYFYVQANGAIAASQTDVSLTSAGQASDGSGTYVNTTAFADNEYGWVSAGSLDA